MGKEGREKMSGKGSKPRPLSVSHKQFGDSWDQIFGKKESINTTQSDDGSIDDGNTEKKEEREASTQSILHVLP